MLNYLCLIVKPNSNLLSNNLIDKAKNLIINCGGQVSSNKWLSHNESHETLFYLKELQKLNIEIKNHMPDFVDCIILPKKNRKKKLLIADMDSTIIKEETLDEVANYLGVSKKISKITELAMDGKIDFEEALRERVNLLKGTNIEILKLVLEKHITINDGAEILIKTSKKNHCKTALVTGGFSLFSNEIGKKLGFDYVISNSLELNGNHLTGNLIGKIIDRAEKKKSLEDLAKKNGINRIETLAVGDGANDIDMIKQAGIGVSYYGKTKLQEDADINISNGNLTSILYIQGYEKKDFVE